MSKQWHREKYRNQTTSFAYTRSACRYLATGVSSWLTQQQTLLGVVSKVKDGPSPATDLVFIFIFIQLNSPPPKKTLTRFNGQADTSVRHLSATHSTDKWQVSSVSSSAFHCGGASFHYFAISFVFTSDDVSDLNVKNCKKMRTAAHHFLVATPLASRIQIFSELSVRRTCSWHGCMVFLKLKKKKKKNYQKTRTSLAYSKFLF